MSGETMRRLRRITVALREVLSRSITATTPAATAASMFTVTAFAGGSRPQSALTALVAPGRIGAFLPPFARVRPVDGSPSVGDALPFAVTVAVTFGLGFEQDPVTAFLLPSTVIVTVVIGVYIVMNLARAGYFLRHGRDPLRPMRHPLFPVLGTGTGLPVLDSSSKPSSPVSYAGPVVAKWLLVGVVVLAVPGRHHPRRTAETAPVHLDDHPTAEPSQTGAAHD
ncbi:hypothetical protein ACWCP6_26385 [Streptomyces sp. NPDC002004]